MAEPQITAISSYFAEHIPTEGVSPEAAREAWRQTLRYARTTGAIEPLTALVERADPEDPTLKAHCEALRR
jgi:hypothetical protein